MRGGDIHTAPHGAAGVLSSVVGGHVSGGIASAGTERAARRGGNGKLTRTTTTTTFDLTDDPALLKRAMTEGRRYLLDALRFLFFLALFTFTSLTSENNQDLYWLGGQVSEFFERSELPSRDEDFPVTLRDIRAEHEVWKYVSGVFYPTLYGAAAWDFDAAFKRSSAHVATGGDTAWRSDSNNRQGWVMGGARLVGGVRVGTIRVTPRFAGDDMCEIAPALGGFSDTNDKTPWKCYPPFQTKTTALQWLLGDPDTEDKTEFGTGPGTVASSTRSVGRWKFNRDTKEPGFMDFRTMAVYPSPGYTVDLPNKESPECLKAFGEEGVELNAALDWATVVAKWRAKMKTNGTSGTDALTECEVLDKIVELYEYGFVDLQTRGLFFDFNLYQPTLDRMVLVRIFFEFRPSGGVLPILDYVIFRPDKYHTFFDFVILAAEGVTLLMVLAYIVEEVLHVAQCVYDPTTTWYEYFLRPGTAPHMLNLFLFLVVYGMSYLARISMPDAIDPSSNAYISLWSPGKWARGATGMTSINVLLTWLKIFRHVSFIPVFAQISRTLQVSFRACYGFIIVIILVGFATATAFLLAFGTRLEGFRNFPEAASSIFTAYMGDISLSELRAANYWLGPLLFIIFLLLGIFVLLNMFIAIIGEAYTTTKEDMRREAIARKLSRDPSAQELVQLYVKHLLFTSKGPSKVAAMLQLRRGAKVGPTPAGGVAGGMMGATVGLDGPSLRAMFGSKGKAAGVGLSKDEKLAAGIAADAALAGEAARLRAAGKGNGTSGGGEGGDPEGNGNADAAVTVDVAEGDSQRQTDGAVTAVASEPFSIDGVGDGAGKVGAFKAEDEGATTVGVTAGVVPSGRRAPAPQGLSVYDLDHTGDGVDYDLANGLHEMSELTREAKVGVSEMRALTRMNQELLRRIADLAEAQRTLHAELAALQSSIILGGSIP